ncbi:MAG: GNAT family N-acetyltransferase [Oscillospiraceae bacterium]
MIIRSYEPADCESLGRLFYETVHSVCAGDYPSEQLFAWADGNIDLSKWNASFLKHRTLVAVVDGKIAGFGDMDETGYLDRLYVGKDFQRRGVASALCAALEGGSSAPTFTTHASITAKPFFQKRGYRVIREQQVERKGILLTNFVMAKENPKITE